MVHTAHCMATYIHIHTTHVEHENIYRNNQIKVNRALNRNNSTENKIPYKRVLYIEVHLELSSNNNHDENIFRTIIRSGISYMDFIVRTAFNVFPFLCFRPFSFSFFFCIAERVSNFESE